MIFKEEKRNLFSVDEKYYLVHCISADFVLGAGIAKEFEKRFNLKSHLFAIYGDSCDYLKTIKIGKVFNLVTKPRYYNKPSYYSLEMTLYDLKEQVKKSNIKYLAMPKIGCGLDKLKWDKVKEIIKEVFGDTDVEILICYL